MKESNPLVSIAIITYNQKEFLKECIDSILIQDYKNIEIVVADDCSIDGTQELLKEYDREYPSTFILELSNTNRGITKNSNKAHFSCSGKYIFWMGGDDLMLPTKIRKQVLFMENNPNCSILYHNLDVFDSKTDTTLYLMNTPKNSFSGNLKDVISKGVFNGACSTVVRTSKTPKHGFDERLPVASDWMYSMETLANGGEILYINEVLGRYRRHSNNVTNNLEKYNGQKDSLTACSLLLIDYPHLNNQILKRYSELLRMMRLYNKKEYLNFLIASIKVNMNIKSILLLFIYVLSLKKIKM